MNGLLIKKSQHSYVLYGAYGLGYYVAYDLTYWFASSPGLLGNYGFGYLEALKTVQTKRFGYKEEA
ncbi:hypothetical protein [Enterobacter cloacae complex sp. 4DZ1-17B1]|uniref:hypothetical protein n=1 Tax=Enterobacter cloacae complex sp. 4DZ1-17B1 TaxID=2511991 RepID=UPI001010E91C|nr:hypothetical protein [Enterobacter cloacae complex sp. 4DZ1-17B1]